MSKQSDFRVKMSMPYEFKKEYAASRIHEFIRLCGKDTFVSVGGLDSIVLLCYIRSLGYNIPAVSVSCIECESVRRVHKELGVIPLKPLKSKYHICKEIGYPLFSKEVSKKVYTITHITDKNRKYAHAILTGETTEKASERYSKMTKLPDKYIELFYNNTPPCNISDRCCYYMKERPVEIWQKEHDMLPFLGLHADESRRRFIALSNNGCNLYGNKARSAPFAIFTKSDILQLCLDIKSPIPTAYGEILLKDGIYQTTGAPRTGCDICGFGIQFEKTRPHRFDLLYAENPKKWDFWINQMQYGKLFDYIGFEYKQPYKTGDRSWRK